MFSLCGVYNCRQVNTPCSDHIFKNREFRIKNATINDRKIKKAGLLVLSVDIVIILTNCTL